MITKNNILTFCLILLISSWYEHKKMLILDISISEKNQTSKNIIS